MSPESELLERLVRDDPIDIGLINRIDPEMLVDLGLALLAQPADERAAQAVAAGLETKPGRPKGGRKPNPTSTPIPAGSYAYAVATDDDEALAMAAHVNVLEIAWLAIVMAGWPATRNAADWLATWVLADRDRVLGESW